MNHQPRNLCCFRRLPGEVEAVQVPAHEPRADLNIYLDQCAAIASWCAGTAFVSADDEDHIEVPTPEGTVVARAGDMVVRSTGGQFYSLPAWVFFSTHEPAVPTEVRFAD